MSALPQLDHNRPGMSSRKPTGALPALRAGSERARIGRRKAPLRRQKCWMVRPMSMGGGALRPPTKRRRHLYPFILLHPVVLQRSTETAKGPEPFLRAPWPSPYPALLWADVETLRGAGLPASPLAKALSRPLPPARTRKTPPPPPASRGPAPTAATMDPDASGQYPAGSRSEDDPCLGLRRRRTGGALASSLSGICATRSIPLSGIRPDFFAIPRLFLPAVGAVLQPSEPQPSAQGGEGAAPGAPPFEVVEGFGQGGVAAQGG